MFFASNLILMGRIGSFLMCCLFVFVSLETVEDGQLCLDQDNLCAMRDTKGKPAINNQHLEVVKQVPGSAGLMLLGKLKSWRTS